MKKPIFGGLTGIAEKGLKNTGNRVESAVDSAVGRQKATSSKKPYGQDKKR